MRRLLLPLFMLLLSLAAGVAAGPAAGQGKSRPNVVVILVDDMGYECLGVNGSAAYRTPNVDRLAAEGVRFTHCYTPPLCTPTRVQLMTGRANYRNYVRFGTLAPAEKTFAHMLKDAGYATAIAGKWQLDEEGGQTPAQAGFDEYCLWNIYHDGKYVRGDRYADPNFVVFDRATGKADIRKFMGDYGPDVAFRYLADFMERSTKAGKPFLAYYPMILTHDPFQPTPKSAQWANGDRHERDDRFYKDMVEYMDLDTGRLVAKLDELGVRKNTLVLYVSDNGTRNGFSNGMVGGRERIGAKGRLTDAGSHTPLIASWPGTVQAGKVCADLVDTTDFLPTIAAATGASLPKPPGDGVIDGRSFLPQLKGEKGKPRDWVLVDYRAGQREGVGRNDGRYVRDHRWKLYGAGKEGGALYQSGSLFDLQNDPDERQPVPAGNADGDAARKRLQAVLDATPSQHR